MLGVALEFKNKPDTTTPINATNLNQMQSSLYNLIMDAAHPVGSYIETDDISYNPNESLVGTWVLENDGTNLVSKSNEEGSVFNVDIGNIVGNENHSHTLDSGYAMIGTDASSNSYNRIKYIDGYTYNSKSTAQSFSFVNGETDSATALGGQTDLESNIQPSKIINRWHRTA